MLGRIVEISGQGRRLSLHRGFLEISGPEGILGQIPLDDIEAVIASTPAVSYTSQALTALAERGAPVVICGPNFTPSAFLLPVDGHHAQGERFEAQAGARLPVRKRLWAEIVKAKVSAQAAALERVGANPLPVRHLVSRIRSGDIGNVEAQAAQKYLPAMFGATFKRDREADGVNAALNYGYTVLRAATARSIVAAGLHPSLGLHHVSKGSSLRLADDLMEPFRPAVDLLVLGMARHGAIGLDPPTKRTLAGVLHADYPTAEGASPLSNALTRLAQSLAQVFLGERRYLAWPLELVPLAPTALAVSDAGGA
ncbi:MAG TPA: type II CRISPR-associated endonuclease Cas1 [Hyphomicrobiaceae bacterium]|nr:type II CRISPR-associated endonuclease Cas1 [Hyphomicrobiaceae bacterium]